MATKTSFVRWIAGAALAAIGLWNGSALAAAPPPVPQTLQQQGRILDSDGAPVSSKVHFVFNVYAKASAGTALWTEEQDITLDDGYFSTELGSVTKIPSDLFDGSTLYLGVTVGNDDEMTPRQTVSSVPYALLAGAAASVSFAGVSDFPAACAAGLYLKGFAADGTPTCVNPALKCHTVVGADVTATTFAFVGCPANEVPVGGGCYTTGSLAASAFYRCTSRLGCLCLVGQPCAGSSDWACYTTAAATITPSIQCCTIQ